MQPTPPFQPLHPDHSPPSPPQPKLPHDNQALRGSLPLTCLRLGTAAVQKAACGLGALTPVDMAGRAALVAAALCASALYAAGEGELRGGRDTGFDGPRLELRVEAMLNDAWTPVSVNLRRTPHKVGLCKLDHELRHQDPSAVPMFQEWSRRSGCTGGAVQHVPLVVYEKVVGSIVDRYEKTGTADEGFPPPVPNGIIYHMMRTGSTLWGNSAWRQADAFPPRFDTPLAPLRSAVPR